MEWQRAGLTTSLLVCPANARHNVGQRNIPDPLVHDGVVDTANSPGKPLSSEAHPTDVENKTISSGDRLAKVEKSTKGYRFRGLERALV